MSNAMTMSMDDTGEPLARRALKIALVLLLHALVLAWMFQQQIRATQEQELLRVDVRLVNELPPPPEKPKPLPPRPQAVPPPTAVAAPPPPVLTAAPSTAPPSATFAVPPQPPAPTRELPPTVPIAPQATPAPPPPPPQPITPARFDADYLKNPAPAYPALSRRLGEEGRVLLLVRVTPQGLPDGVEVRESSGFARLDEAALAAVRQWRFVPARRGSEAIAASVLVPIIFRRGG